MNYEFLKDFIYPAFVAIVAAYASYQGSYKLNEKALREANESRVIDLTNSLIIEINKLNNIFEKLKEDIEKYSFFSLQNSKTALNSGSRLRVLNEQVILFKDDELRRQIIENTDLAISLIEEIDLMENILVNEQTKLDNKKKEAEKEYRDMRLRLLSLDIFIDPIDNKAKYLKELSTKKRNAKSSDSKIDTIEAIMRGLVGEIDSSDLDRLRKNYEKKRNLLVVRILDTQTKLRELVNKLNS